MIRAYVVLALILLTVGCNSEDPNPELKDPIYKDLKGRAEAHNKTIEETKKKLAELRIAFEKAEANSIEQKDVRRDIAKAEATIREGDKWSKYYKIRADRRAVVDKISAREAASAGKEWPDPHEYSDYQVNKRLNEASRNWGSRVPRLQDRLPKKVEKESGEKPSPAPAPSEH